MLMYRVDSDKPSPVPVECPDPRWPNLDADGEKIYDNTHFASLAEAWVKLQSECNAGVRLGCATVTELRRRLAEAEATLVERTLLAEAVREGHKDWLRAEEDRVDNAAADAALAESDERIPLDQFPGGSE